MDEQWKQFTLYPPGCKNKFQPLQILHTFLPDWLNKNPTIIQWHVLFEPSALIRFQSKLEDLGKILTSAYTLSKEHGLEFYFGDASSEINPDLKCPDENYTGEADVYGDSLWKANCKFMQACGELSIEISKLPHTGGKINQVFAIRKFLHLYYNTLGFNFLEESGHSRLYANLALDRYKDHGRS